MISPFTLCVAIYYACIPLEENRPELRVDLIPQELLTDAYSVVRESFTTYEITSTRSYTRNVREAITLLDKRSGYQALYVPYDQYSKARIISAHVYDKDGSLIRKMQKEDIVDVSAFGGSLYADQRVLSIALVGGAFPYTVSYEYEITYNETQYYPEWEVQDYHVSVQRAEMHLLHSQFIIIHALPLNTPDAKIDEITNNGQRLRKWQLNLSTAIRAELMASPAYTVLPAVHFAPEEFIVAKYQGSMSDWKRFGKFIYELNAGRDALSPKMAERVQRMTSSAKGNKEKINILYRYLQDNMRYVSVQVGIGGWQAYDAKYVEENKFGDCKALSYFMKGMLAEAGINAWPVLIYASEGKAFFSPDFVTAGSFDHVILYVPDEDLWLECTSKLNPTGYLNEVTNDRSVVCITPSGGIISRTPSHALDNSLTQTRDSIYFNASTWHLNGKRKFAEAAHEYYRGLKNYLTITEQDKEFREDFALPIKQLSALEYSAEKDINEAGCTYQVALTQFGSVSGSRLFLPVNPLYRFKTPCTTDRRTHDIFLDEPLNEINEIQIHLPEGYQIESSVTAKHFTEPQFGEYHLEVNAIDGVVSVKRHLKIPRLDLSVEQYAALCTFFSSIENADKATIVLKKVAE